MCRDRDECYPGERCKPAEPSGVGLSQRADSLGVRRETFTDARVRMHNTDHDVVSQQAVTEGCYIHSGRKTRSDVTKPEVTALASVYWHSDDISCATGNPGFFVLFSAVYSTKYLVYL